MPVSLTITRAQIPEDVRVTYVGKFWTHGTQLFAVGGAYSTPMLLCSKDHGRTFQSWSSPKTTGLRDMLVDEDLVWVVGEKGMVARTADEGANWDRIRIDSTSCVYAIERDPGGRIWLSGVGGLLRRSTPSGAFERVPSRITQNVSAIYFDPVDGSPWLLGITTLQHWNGKRFEPVDGPSSAKKPSLAKMLRTPTGALVVVGREGVVLRSTNDGRTWKKIATRITTDLDDVAVTPYGILAVGDRLHVSLDDGKTFTIVDMDATSHLWSIAIVPGALLLGGSDAIYRITTAELATLIDRKYANDEVLAGLVSRVRSGDDGADLVLEDALRERSLL